MGSKQLISHLIIKNVQIEPRMSLALCLKAKICKKGKLVRNMEEGSWGHPWSAANRAKMAKYRFFMKKSGKKAKIAMAFLKNIYISKKSMSWCSIYLEEGAEGSLMGVTKLCKN